MKFFTVKENMMAKLLYVTCNLKPLEHSRSLSVGNEFLDEYLRRNPGDEVHFLELYRDNIQRVDADVLGGWGKMRNGESFDALTIDEQRKIGRIWKHADQFIASDKFVFVTPMFNLGFPAEFKMYIDAICVVGKTFTYTPHRPCGASERPGQEVSPYSFFRRLPPGKEEDHSVPYLRSIMNFMGVEDFNAIVLEGVDTVPEKAEEFKMVAIQQARAAAKSF